MLDGMAASSLNVFHWHLTDAQAFPWNSTAEPKLVQGAYRDDLTFQRSDLELVVSYAADRAIRVVPEIDMPGHAASFAIGRSVQCSVRARTWGSYCSPDLPDHARGHALIRCRMQDEGCTHRCCIRRGMIHPRDRWTPQPPLSLQRFNSGTAVYVCSVTIRRDCADTVLAE